MSNYTYCLRTACDGSDFSVNFFPEGNGYSYDDYITSFGQFVEQVEENFGSSNLDLCYITSDGELKQITSNTELCDAVEPLPHRGVLSVTAIYSSSKKGRKKTRQNKKSKNKKKQQEKFDSDSEDSDYNTDTEPGYYAEEKVDKKSKAKIKVLNGDKALVVIKHFTKHYENDAKCHHCPAYEFSGVRYHYAHHYGYSMCDDCHSKLSKSEKSDWPCAGLPWDGDAPAFPLYNDESYTATDDVRHLQCLLTLLGFMSQKETSEVTGSFQYRTENAVKEFRKKYGIKGGDMSVYDRKTAEKLAQVVRKLRQDGHAYL